MARGITSVWMLGLAVATATGQPCEPAWTAGFGGGDAQSIVRSLAVFDEDGAGSGAPALYAGGGFAHAGGVPGTGSIARWDGARWSPVGGSVAGTVFAMTVYDEDGAGPLPPVLVAAGSFLSAGGVSARRIAAWNGEAWRPLGEGLGSSPHPAEETPFALAVFDEDGPGPRAPALYAAGEFLSAGGAPAARIARWNGEFWSEVGGGLSAEAFALATFDPDGAGPQSEALYVGGDFRLAGGQEVWRIARWDGFSFSAVGPGVGPPAAPCDCGVRALLVHDDGAGPALYVGGRFSEALGGPGNRIARWDGAVWSALGEGMNADVTALGVFDPDGAGPAPPQLHAGGIFTSTGGATLNRIGRWDGAAWRPLGAGLGGGFPPTRVDAMTAFDADGAGPGGEALHVGGNFTTAGAGSAGFIATWDGAAWRGLGGGLADSPQALLAVGAGEAGAAVEPGVYAGGYFSVAGGRPVSHLARWDGARWWDVGGGTSPGGGRFGFVYALALFDDDGPGPRAAALYVGGEFEMAGDVAAARIARWDGAAWSPLGDGITSAFPPGSVRAMAVFDEDGAGPKLPVLFVGGQFTHAGGVPAAYIARWDGTEWSAVGKGTNNIVTSLAVFDDDGPGPRPTALYAGGVFTTADGAPAARIARWDGAAWSTVGAGMSDTVEALCVFDEDGPGSQPAQLYAGGQFTSPAFHLARWDGAGWSAAGAFNDDVRALGLFDADGAGPVRQRLIAGGSFTSAGGALAARIATYDGAIWSPLGAGVSGGAPVPSVAALAALERPGAAPALFAGGAFAQAGGLPSENIAQWNCPVAGCYADCDGSGGLDFFDFLCFQSKFPLHDPYADCDQSGKLDFFDFLCFQEEFATGCP